ncbi:tyrosine-type recombinase/integrase, partial [Bacillus taeanensis]
MRKRAGASTVEPIRDPEKIREMKEYLLHKSYRDYFLFTFGINSGLRISDILLLRAMDVTHTTHLKVREQKTGHIRKVKMPSALQNEIERYTHRMAPSDFLFPSRQGDKPISRVQAWNIINEAAREAG